MKKLFKIWMALFVVFMGTGVMLAMFSEPTKRPMLSTKQWKEHKREMAIFTKGLFSKDGPQGMYDYATDLLNQRFMQECEDPGCPELRYLLERTQKVTGDGRLTPAGLEELKQDGFAVADAIHSEERHRAPAHQK